MHFKIYFHENDSTHAYIYTCIYIEKMIYKDKHMDTPT